jgi:O-antigen/teichoic acid export membrane protein
VRSWLARHLGDPLYRQSYLMLGSTAVSAGTGLLFWLLAARVTDAGTVGLGAALIAAVSFLSYLTSMALPYGILRFARATTQLGRVLNTAVWASVLTSVLAALVYAAGAGWWAPKLSGLLDSAADVALFALAGAGTAAGLLVDNALAARRRGGIALARNAVAGIGKLALLPLMVDAGPAGVYLAMTLPLAVSAFATLAVLPKLIPGYSPLDLRGGPEVRALFGFSLRNYPAALASGAPMFLLPVIAANLLTPAGNAYFYIAWSIGQVAQLLPGVVSSMALSEGATEGAAGSAARGQRFTLTLLVPGCVVAVLLAGPAMALYGPGYRAGATTPLQCFVVAAVPWALVLIAQARLRAEDRYRDVTALTLLLCACTLGLPLLGGRLLGLPGIGLGWLAGATLTALPVALRRQTPVRSAL